MRESRTYGSARGVLGNGHPYRKPSRLPREERTRNKMNPGWSEGESAPDRGRSPLLNGQRSEAAGQSALKGSARCGNPESYAPPNVRLLEVISADQFRLWV